MDQSDLRLPHRSGNDRCNPHIPEHSHNEIFKRSQVLQQITCIAVSACVDDVAIVEFASSSTSIGTSTAISCRDWICAPWRRKLTKSPVAPRDSPTLGTV